MLKSILEGGKVVDEGELGRECLDTEVIVKSQLIHAIVLWKSSGIRDARFLWRQQRDCKQDDCWKFCPKQSFSTLSLLTFWAGDFLCGGLAGIVDLTSPLASMCQMLKVLPFQL